MNIVAIGGHGDDIELGCGGTMSRYKDMGHNTFGIVVAKPSPHGFITNAEARLEFAESAQILGFELIELNREPRTIPYDIGLITEIEGWITKLRADVVLTHWVHDIHQDHAAVARATITAARKFPRLLMYHSNYHNSYSAFNGTFYVDISDYIGFKVDAIKVFSSESNRLGMAFTDVPVVRDRIAGVEIGVEYAEVFEVVKWLCLL